MFALSRRLWCAAISRGLDAAASASDKSTSATSLSSKRSATGKGLSCSTTATPSAPPSAPPPLQGGSVASSSTSSGTPSPSPLNEAQTAILKYPYQVIETEKELQEAVDVLQRSQQISLDVEAFCTPDSVKTPQLGQISLVQSCSDIVPVVFLFDILSLSVPTFTAAFRPVLSNDGIRKLFFDCRRDIEALSTQMGIVPTRVLDLQLFFTAVQWKLRSVNRRSGMTYVLKNIAGVERQEGDSAVQTAMSVGDRPVWDTRPLPSHFLEYAADDVRHIQLLSTYFPSLSQHAPIAAVERLTAQYVQHYGVGHPVTVEADVQPAQVNAAWLERYLGPGGVCSFCGSKGHIEAECFRKQNGNVRCSYCGAVGHTSRNCFQKHPELLKCDLCGQLGHNAASCFKTNPCKYCGGRHRSENCHRHASATRSRSTQAARDNRRK